MYYHQSREPAQTDVSEQIIMLCIGMAFTLLLYGLFSIVLLFL